MGVRLDDIRQGLRTFDTTFFQAPGRMNVFDEHPFRVILDYGHNAAAVEAMCNLISRLECPGRRIAVLAAPGDRRDEDIRNIATIAASHFDHFVCKRDDGLRGRGPDEVPNMLAEALRDAGVADEAIEIIPDEAEAIGHALDSSRPGDLLLIFADNLARGWKQVIHFEADTELTPSAPIATGTVQLPPPPAEVLPTDDELIRDERGVRLARIHEEAD
jgi:cyanophycin synthetase